MVVHSLLFFLRVFMLLANTNPAHYIYLYQSFRHDAADMQQSLLTFIILNILLSLS